MNQLSAMWSQDRCEPMIGAKFHCLVTEADVYEQLAQSRYSIHQTEQSGRAGSQPATSVTREL